MSTGGQLTYQAVQNQSGFRAYWHMAHNRCYKLQTARIILPAQQSLGVCVQHCTAVQLGTVDVLFDWRLHTSLELGQTWRQGGASELHLKAECLLAIPFAPEPAVTRCSTPSWHSSASNALDLEPASSST